MPSKALYLDSKVGINPATEPYAEKMRNLETLRVESEVNKQNILNTNLKLKNSIIQNGGVYITSINTFNKVTKSENKESLTISLIEVSKAVDITKSYELVVDFELNSNYEIEISNNGKTFIINWNSKIDESLIENLIIVDSDKTIVITK